ncbi:MAG: sugar phosphate isomerase/epimerase [Gemmatimonadaceae bacterium]
MPNRRDFLSTLGLALGATTLGRPRALAAMTSAPMHLPRIGIQLYTVRSLTEKDLEGTLARLAGIGYSEVEFAGYFGKTPEQIRAMLIANRLSSPSSHIPLPANDDAWSRALADARTIGHEWAVIPWLDPSQRKDWGPFADRLNHLATMARAAGMRFAYHNHDFEFAKEGSGTVMDLLLKNTDPALVDFEMDIYWVTKAGADPLDLIKRYPHRFPLMHAKDASAGARAIVDVGKGTINFARIFQQERTSGMQHVYVENDNPVDAIQSATTSFQYLSHLKY